MFTKCIKISLIILIVLGIILIGLGVGLIYEFKKLIHDKITQEDALVNGSEAYNNWVSPPVPVHMQFWVFNVTNAAEVMATGAKPKVAERGPYTYREIRDKESLEFLDNGTKIRCREPKFYVFDPEMSVGSENDTFTSVNLFLLTLATTLPPPIPEWIWKQVIKLSGEHLFEEYTVGGYLYGYEDPFLKEIKDLLAKFGFHPDIPDIFGLFSGATGNGTDDGNYTFFTGSDDISKLNVIAEWNGNSSVPYWTTDYCNMINGTDGSLWPPFVKETDTLYIFSSDVCRSVYLTNIGSTKSYGIHLLQFSPPASVFENSETNPDNEGFCTPNQDHCLGSGVLNVSTCRDGAPIIMSQPHFYAGDQKYIDAIDGISPNYQHKTIISVDPYTGAALNASKKLQINAYIEPLSVLPDTQYMNKTIFPLVWLNESAVMDEDTANKFKDEVLKPILITYVVQYGLIALGGALLIIALILFITATAKERKEDSRKLIVNKGEEDEGENDEPAEDNYEEPPFVGDT